MIAFDRVACEISIAQERSFVVDAMSLQSRLIGRVPRQWGS